MMNSEPDYACDLVHICMEENINQMEENIKPANDMYAVQRR